MDDQVFPELVFACVGGLGTDFNEFAAALSSKLKKFNYELHTIKITEQVKEHISSCESFLYKADKDEGEIKEIKNDAFRDELRRIATLQSLCNKLRKKCKYIMALLAIRKIFDIRTSSSNKDKRQAYLIVSLKNPDDFNLLKKVYRKNLILISIYTPKKERGDYLRRKINRIKIWLRSGSYQTIKELNSEIDKLMNTDKEDETENGQNVSKVYPNADYFIRSGEMKHDLKRMVELLFGAPFITPTKDEVAMCAAHMAAMRSSDLKRQVGAIIIDDDGNIIASGCNEVAKPGGGQYWEGDFPDLRDFKLRKSINEEEKQKIVNELCKIIENKLNDVIENGLLSKLKNDLNEEFLNNTKIKNIIEFLRPVHAEGAAISDAARRGVSTKGGILYSTTFPCHLCAKKIVAAGIKKVIYVAPYSKSKTKEMYNGIIIDKPEGDVQEHNSQVVFDSYYGISPKLYQYIFDLNYREKRVNNKEVAKNSVIYKKSRPVYITYQTPLGYIFKECNCVRFLKEHGFEESSINKDLVSIIEREDVKGYFLAQKRFLFDEDKK
jgi:deoxycytidylate deaminase